MSVVVSFTSSVRESVMGYGSFSALLTLLFILHAISLFSIGQSVLRSGQFFQFDQYPGFVFEYDTFGDQIVARTSREAARMLESYKFN